MRHFERFNGLDWLSGLGVFAYLMAFPQTLDPADESFVLYGASRVLKGQAIYRDFFEFITPASFYLFAGVYAVTGPSLLASRAVMAAANALSCVFLFGLVRRAASPVVATVAVLAFAVLCLPVWRMVSPHWLSTTLCLGTAAVLLSPRWTEGTGGRALAVGALAGLTFCTQQHRGVFLTIWVLAAIVARSLPAARALGWHVCRRQIAWMAVGWLAVATGILGYTVWRASLGDLVYATFTFVFREYFAMAHGPALSGKVSWAGVGPLNQGLVSTTWLTMLELFPWLLVADAIALAWAAPRGVSRALIVRGSTLFLAVLMSGCILYYPDFIHVAFIAPFFLIVAAGLAGHLRALPAWNLSWVRLAFAATAILVCAALLIKGRTNLEGAWRDAPERFDTAVGPVDSTAPMRKALETVRHVLSPTSSRPKTLFSYPGDAWFYLALPADNPTPFDLLLSGYNTPEQFRQALGALRHNPPDGVVVNAIFSRPERDPDVAEMLRGYQLAAEAFVYQVYVRKRDE